jgi:hypothetical protein
VLWGRKVERVKRYDTQGASQEGGRKGQNKHCLMAEGQSGVLQSRVEEKVKETR